jgi:FKBP-type peptidyl-prolyl cis-trans isomerase FkpA
MNQYQKTACGISATLTMVLGGAALAADTKPVSEDDKAFYFIGTAVAKNLAPFALSDSELAMIVQGLSDTVNGEPIVLDESVYSARANEIAQERVAVLAEVEKTAAADYVEKMAAEKGATTTDSGIVILELVAGTGDSPTASSTIKAHYHGTLRDGTVFDSSVDRGQPFETSLSGVIRCWQEAIPTMKEGGKSKITCPAAMAYGDQGAGAIPPGSALTFEVELIDVIN